MPDEIPIAMAVATGQASSLVAKTLGVLLAVEEEGQSRVDWLHKMRHHNTGEGETDPTQRSARELVNDSLVERSSDLPPPPPSAELSALREHDDHTGKYVYSDIVIERAASLLLAVPSLVRGQRVLELGCGLASLSHICATLGAATVVATDGEDTTVMAARTVAKAASLVSRSEDASCKPNIDSIEFSTLRWGNVTAIEALGDGHGGSGAGGFDLVLGTELMYYATVVDALVATIATALRRSAIDPSLEAPRKVPACAVLSHFFRRADLSQELVAACHEHGLTCLDLVFPAAETDTCRTQLLCWKADVEVLQRDYLPSEVISRPLEEAIAEEEAEDDVERIIGGFEYDESIFE